MTHGQRAYEAYAKHAGPRMLTWSALGEAGRAAWDAVGVALLGEMTSELVTSVAIEPAGAAHARVRVWNRGGLAGELIVNRADGPAIARRLCPGWVHTEAS